MSDESLKKFTTAQLLNFCIGFFGLQFAWQMRIILSGPVTEALGANPFIFGLIWLAGPVTGMVVQPLIGAMSDSTQTRFGRRIPYLFGGALFGAAGLILLPHSGQIATLLGGNLPVYTGLLIAAILIWAIDASVNAAQGPYRALIPDNIPVEQHALANSYLSFAIGLGSVIAAGTAPFLKWAFGIQMSTSAQFLMAGIAFLLAMTWTCLTIKERKIKKQAQETEKQTNEPGVSFIDSLKCFFAMSPEVTKICLIQFFSWIGLMSLMIFFTQYVIHIIYQVPDLTAIDPALKIVYEQKLLDGQNFSSICFAMFNLICFIIAIPIGKMAEKYGSAKVHFTALISMALSYLILAFIPTTKAALIGMGLAGIGWASVLALPFAMLSKYIKAGTEGSMMGIFNIFISAPQVLVCTLLAWFVSKSVYDLNGLPNNHWEYAFLVGAISLVIAAFATLTLKEKA